GRWQRCGDDEQSEQARGEVDVEYPAPAQVIDEEPAEQRTDDGGKTERGSEKALVSRAFARGDDIPDHCNDSDDQPTGAYSLQGPKRDKLAHVLGKPTQRGAYEE